MIPVTLLFVFLAALAPWVYATHEAGVDVSKIAADGSADSLKEDFHKRNFQMRAWMALLCTIVFSGLLYLCGFRWWFFAAYFFYFATAFGYYFTKSLNHARHLHPFYVSTDPRAAVSDRLLVKMAWLLGILQPEAVAAIVYTGFLVAGILAFAGAIVGNWLVIRGF